LLRYPRSICKAKKEGLSVSSSIGARATALLCGSFAKDGFATKVKKLGDFRSR